MLHVYLYENGTRGSFANLSGQEIASIEETVDRYGDLETDGEEDYATIEVSHTDATRLRGTRIGVQPRQLGLNPWGNVELEFVDPESGVGIRGMLPEIREKASKVQRRLQGERIARGLAGTNLPADVVGNITKFAATPKAEGGKRQRKTRKLRKSKKTRKTRGRK
jgi:hypothetical protein